MLRWREQNFSGHFQIPAYDIDVELCNPGWLKPQEKAAIEKAEGISAKPDNKGRPALIAALLSHKIYYMYHMGWMNAAVLKKCDKCINDFVGAWMACEKIVGVPMVFPYTQMLSVFMVLFVYTFPFPLAHIFFNEDAEFNGFFITPFICARAYPVSHPSTQRYCPPPLLPPALPPSSSPLPPVLE